MQIELGAFSIDKVLLLFRAKLFPLVQRKKRKKESDVSQLCPNLYDLMDCSLPGFSVHGIYQVRVLE